MIYKQCIDACFEAVKANERCAYEALSESKKQCSDREACIICSDICDVTARLCSRGEAHHDMFEFCTKTCDETAERCDAVGHEYAQASAQAARKAAEACRQCATDCR